jgi:heptosyltransferase I
VQDQYFEFLEHLGVDPHPAVWDLPITVDERAAQRAFFAALDRPACAVVVGTSKREKDWDAPGYARVLADRFLHLTRARPLDLLGDDIRRLVWLIEGSALVISPDTGPLHIARALDVPVVGLFGNTNPKRTGPYRRFQDLVVDGYADFAGEDYPVGPTRRDGMARVSVNAVLDKISLARARYPR